MITSGEPVRGTYALGGGDFPMSRTDPDGNSSDGTAIEVDCSEATVSGSIRKGRTDPRAVLATTGPATSCGRMDG